MRAGKRWGAAVVASALAATLTAGAAGAVALRDEPGATAPAAAPTPTPAPARGALLAALPDGAPLPTEAGLAAEVAAALADPALGGRLAVSVLDAESGRPLLERDAGSLLLPASTAKIVTAVAALTSLDPALRLRTRVLSGPAPGEVVLVGGGDTLLASSADAARDPDDARLDVLAQQVTASLAGVPVTKVLVDDSLYTGPLTAPGWKDSYVADGNVAPVMALSVDGGRVRPDRSARSADPALAAGAALAALLAPPGGPVPAVERGAATAGAAELGAVEGPTIASAVERMLATSDNDLAESLARQVAIAQGQPASFEGVARALQAASAPVLEQAGVAAAAVQLVDGSGLSRLNVVAPGALTRLLTVVARDPGRLAPVLSGLPVAGFSGTLSERYREGPAEPAAGEVRAKTGTLQGVSALAGLVRTDEGRLLAFDVTTDGVAPGANRAAEVALDRLAAALASCGCR